MRPLSKVRAYLGGFFWLPCPLCGRNFGGQDLRKGRSGFIEVSPVRGKGICPTCTKEGRADWPPIKSQRSVTL